MFRLLGSVARGSSAVGVRNTPKTGIGGIGGGGPATTALFCISALWSVGQTVSFATVRTPQAMSSTIDVSLLLVCFSFFLTAGIYTRGFFPSTSLLLPGQESASARFDGSTFVTANHLFFQCGVYGGT